MCECGLDGQKTMPVSGATTLPANGYPDLARRLLPLERLLIDCGTTPTSNTKPLFLQFSLPVVPRYGKVVTWQVTATTELGKTLQRVSVGVLTLRNTRLSASRFHKTPPLSLLAP